jgi:hypothetical protein
VAQQKAPPKSWSLVPVIDRELLEHQADWAEVVDLSGPALSLSRDLYKRLLNGAKNEILGRSLAPSLNLEGIANFLTDISATNAEKLPGLVKCRLKELGIPQLGGKLGHPSGRKQDRRYLVYVEEVEKRVGKLGLFEAKKAAMREKRHTQFAARLKRDGWPDYMINLLLTAKSSRSFAVYVTAYEFDVAFDTVDKGCRRAKRARNT